MRPVRSAKGIVHIQIAKFGKRLREGRVIGFLARLEADILEQRDIAVLHVLDDFSWHVANCVMAKNDGLMNQRMQIFADRAQRIFFRRLSLGPSEMRHQDRLGSVLAQVIDRRQTLPDSRVISDSNFAAARFGRHIKIHAHQHTSPAHIQIAY